MSAPPRVHLIGRSGCGKTTFAVELLQALCRRGLRVGAIKHSGHVHELDHPGKDSHRLREAGGDPTAVIATGMAAVFFPLREGRDLHQEVLALFSACDLVLAEGRHHAPEERPNERVLWIEIFRRGCAERPLCETLTGVAAVVGDEPVEGVPHFESSDSAGVAQLVIETLGLGERAG